MCFSSTLSYLHKEFLKPRPPRTRTNYNPHPPRSKFNPHPPRTQSSAGSRIHPANASTRNPHGLTRPAQNSSAHLTNEKFLILLPHTLLTIWKKINQVHFVKNSLI